MTAAGPAVFDELLAGPAGHLVRDDGLRLATDPGRWRAASDADDARLLERCTGPTLDLGCGPGRLVAALAARGVPALGVDSSPVAQALCRRRGAAVVRRDAFADLPGEGAWAHVLLVDGNIGIGGDPVRLLGRAAALLRPGGSVLVETGPRPGECWRGRVRTATGAELAWACVGVDALRALAPAAGLRVSAVSRSGTRTFAELVA